MSRISSIAVLLVLLVTITTIFAAPPSTSGGSKKQQVKYTITDLSEFLDSFMQGKYTSKKGNELCVNYVAVSEYFPSGLSGVLNEGKSIPKDRKRLKEASDSARAMYNTAVARRASAKLPPMDINDLDDACAIIHSESTFCSPYIKAAGTYDGDGRLWRIACEAIRFVNHADPKTPPPEFAASAVSEIEKFEDLFPVPADRIEICTREIDLDPPKKPAKTPKRMQQFCHFIRCEEKKCKRYVEAESSGTYKSWKELCQQYNNVKGAGKSGECSIALEFSDI